MHGDTTRFTVAGGTCRIGDDTLVIDRSDPLREGRLATLANGLSVNAKHRPLRTASVLAVVTVLGLVFVWVLAYLYRSNPAVTPLLLVLVFLAFLATGVPLERAFRQARRERRALLEDLGAEFRYERPEEISVDAIERATLRQRDTGGRFGDGYLLLVHYEDGTDRATTHLRFPGFLESELETVRAAFERRGIDVKADDGGGSAKT